MVNYSSVWVSWNAVTWCDLYSDWCKNCYAKWMAIKWQKLWIKKYINWFNITIHEDALNFPEKTKRPSLIFANSMTDLFHEKIPFEYLKKIFDIMNKNKNHIFFILTKRAENMLKLSKKLEIWDNIRMWVTVENEKYTNRINLLKQVKSKYKYIVCEPLLSSIDLWDIKWFNWVSWWNESWPNRRPVKEEWVENINQQCKKYNIPFSFKLRWRKDTFFWNKKYNEIPEEIREFMNKSLAFNPKGLKCNENQTSLNI